MARRVVTRLEVAEVRAAGGALSRVRTTKVKKPAFRPGDITAWLSATLPTSCAVELARRHAATPGRDGGGTCD